MQTLSSITQKVSIKPGELQERTKRDRLFGLTKLFNIYIKLFAAAVFKSLEGKGRKSALENIFSNSDNICIAAKIFRDQLHASKKNDHKRDEEFFLSDNELEDIRTKLIDQYESITVEEFIKLPSPYDVLFAWRDATGSKEAPAKLLSEAFSEDGHFIKALESLKYVSSSAQEGIPRLIESHLEHFVDATSIKERLVELSHSKSNYAEEASDLLSLWWSNDDWSGSSDESPK